MPTEQQLANRKRLIDALRAEMPPHFKWNFDVSFTSTTCGAVGCALGLAKIIGLVDYAFSEDVAAVIGVGRGTAQKIFTPAGEGNDRLPGYGVRWDQVTPQMVADKLEALSEAERA